MAAELIFPLRLPWKHKHEISARSYLHRERDLSEDAPRASNRLYLRLEVDSCVGVVWVLFQEWIVIQMRRGKGSFYHRSIRRSIAATCMLALAGLTSAASAQDAPVSPGLALNRFTPAPTGDRMFGVQSPYVAGELTPHASLLFDYARNPLVLKTADKEALGAIVSNQLFLHLNAGFAFANKVNFNISLPVALSQGGDSPTGGGLQFTSPSGLAVGDLRFGARVNLIGSYWDPFQLAVGGYVWLPTGDSGENSFVGEGARALPQVIAGGLVSEKLVWSFARRSA